MQLMRDRPRRRGSPWPGSTRSLAWLGVALRGAAPPAAASLRPANVGPAPSSEDVLYGFDEDRPSHTSVGLASLVVLLAGLQTDYHCSKSRLI